MARIRRPPLHSGKPTAPRLSPAFTILELLVSMVVIGLLAGILLPAIGRARESARRMQCSNHLRQIGTACHSHHNAMGRLPLGWKETAGRPTGWGWGARLLVYLEQSSVADQIRFDLPVDHPHHHEIREQSLSVFRCPSDHMPDTFLLLQGGDDDDDDDDVQAVEQEHLPLYTLPAANYVAMFGKQIPDESPPDSGDGAFIGNRAFRLDDLQQGTSNTLLVGERTAWLLPSTWLGMDLRSHEGPGRIVGSATHPPNDLNADECEFSSRHEAGSQFVFGDGHVEMVSSQVSLPVYQRLASRLPCR